MAREERAATFIWHNMPQSAPGTLTPQQAFDLSAFINAHPRPDSPGKESDWPMGGAPRDVPYRPHGHAAFHPPRQPFPLCRRADALHRLGMLLLFAVPGAANLVQFRNLPASGQVLAAVVGVLSAAIGVLAERWLFFAEAEHVSMLYYGETRA